MKALLALLPVTVFAVASCGSQEPTPAPASGGNDSASASGLGPARTCKPTCTTASDCATPGQALQDAGHYACNAGRCQWLGCQSDSDCQSAFGTNKLTCRADPSTGVKTCMHACQAAADCAVQGSQLTTANHFTCNAGGTCEWLGCASTNDCSQALHSNRFVCEQPQGAPHPLCMPTCQTPADCAVPGSNLTSANHFACNAGRCKWLGCKSTAECAADLHVSNVVCE